MLAVTGELDERQGGPYVPTHRTDSGEVVIDESAAGATRRSVYLQQRRTEITSLLEVFDAPSIVTTCTRRISSTIPLQSLSLMNSDFVVARAQKLAMRLEVRVQRTGMITMLALTGRSCSQSAEGQCKTSTTPQGDFWKHSLPAIPHCLNLTRWHRPGGFLPDAAGEQRISLR